MFYAKLLKLPNLKYFMLELVLTFGGMGLLPQSRGGACFCTRGAMQGYDGYYLILCRQPHICTF